jgi:HK97 gp10 family phage protein
MDGYQAFMAKYAGAVDKAVGKAAVSMQGDIKRSYQITGPMPGIGPGVAGHNVPSNPGETPAVQTGQLRRSTVAMNISTARWGVFAQMFYSKMLEFGTSKMEPRPFMIPGMMSRANQKKALAAAVRGLRAGLKSIAGGKK